MESIKPYISLAYTIFLIIYWFGVGILIYHLKRFGIGIHAKRMLYVITIGSIFLTIITTLFYIKI